MPTSEMPRRRRRLLRILLTTAGVLAGLGLAGGTGIFLWFRAQLPQSLPQMQGTLHVEALAHGVTIQRDGSGIPTLQGENRRDLALATGFLHAQERFFQMDLLRRRAAGELAELVGGLGLPPDRWVRRHRFRERARRALEEEASPTHRRLLEAYARGVNTGLAALEAPPFEYLILRQNPKPWRPEDSFLVMLAMSLQLEGGYGSHETLISVLHELYPEPMARFLTPRGSEWNAPLIGESFLTPPIPKAGTFDLRAPSPAKVSRRIRSPDPESAWAAGSNAWAVDGEHSADGALLANELHLELTVPNLWYRTALLWPGHRVYGVTLPGLPSMVVGSNTRIAWGYSSSLVDTSDIVLLEVDSNDPERYLTPDGYRRFEHYEEILRIGNDDHETMDVVWTIWGPVLPPDALGRPRALRWTVHEPGAVDLEIQNLETARSVPEALDVGNRSGAPSLNLVVADAEGRVGWTVLGRLPRRSGFDGRIAGSWSDGSRRWEGLLDPTQAPRVVDPENGRIWTANNRVAGDEMLEILGDGGYLPGARARLIRDGLLAIDRATPESMLEIQRDIRATFLERWRRLLLDRVLTPEALVDHPRRQEFRELVEHWEGRASVDAAGYRMVRYFRVYLARAVFDHLTREYRQRLEDDADFLYIQAYPRFEGTLWKLVTEQPLHLLDPHHATWQEQLLAAVDETIELSAPDGRPLEEATWGERNTTTIRHPLSVIPGLGGWLDMPPLQLPGDNNMPRVQHPHIGSTLRMVVSPGREEAGFFTMPGGQSGHPESPHYRDAHADWAAAAPAPFLPGPTRHVLRLVPADGS